MICSSKIPVLKIKSLGVDRLHSSTGTMALGMVALLKWCVWLGLAHHFVVVSACHGSYGQLIEEFCLSKFKSDMETLRKTLWCNWDKTLGKKKHLLPFIQPSPLGIYLYRNASNKVAEKDLLALAV
ncbi:receptor activity-modifying protein 1 isoform 3-T3 [Liasis olivaceus]